VVAVVVTPPEPPAVVPELPPASVVEEVVPPALVAEEVVPVVWEVVPPASVVETLVPPVPVVETLVPPVPVAEAAMPSEASPAEPPTADVDDSFAPSPHPTSHAVAAIQVMWWVSARTPVQRCIIRISLPVLPLRYPKP